MQYPAKFLAVLGCATALSAPVLAEGVFAPSRSMDIQLKRGLTEAEAKAAVISLREQKRRVIDVEVFSESTACAKNTPDAVLKAQTCKTILKYDLLSEPNPTGRSWDLNIGEDADGYAASWKTNSGKGWRLASLAPRAIHTFTGSGPLAKTVHYASLWTDDATNIGWVSFSRMTNAEFSAKFKEFAEDKGMVVTSYASYELFDGGCDKAMGPNERCIAATFAKPPGDAKFAFLRNQTPDAYTEQREKYEKGGFRSMLLSNGEKMATSFLKHDGDGEWKSFSRLTGAEFDKTNADLKKQGWRLVDYEAAQMNGEKDASFNGTRIHGGIWFKPAPLPKRAKP